MSSKPFRRNGEGGQILVLFTLALVAIIAMVGLVLDGGAAFSQRRVEQTAADLGAVAGANAYMNAGTGASAATRTAAAHAAAHAAATRNGYTNGTNNTTIVVSVSLLASGGRVTVAITSPYSTNFSRVVGQTSWDVSVTAAAIAGTIDTATGAAPWTMHIDAFNGATPLYGVNNPQDFGESNGDYPTGPLDIAWTDFNGANNVNTNEVRDIIVGTNVVTETIMFEQYVGQHNQGNHTALYGDVDTHLSGHTVPVPIVGDCPNGVPSVGGCFKGWALFHIISAQGGSSKTITGYFLPELISSPLSVGNCTPEQAAANQCGLVPTGGQFGQYLVRLDQ